MFNLLSGEFYKWKKSKSFWACLIAAIAMVLLIFFSYIWALQIQNGQVENGTGGVYVNGDVSEIGILDIIGEVSSAGVNLIFLGIFICIWVVGEFSHGAIKNVAGKGYSRKKVFLAKYMSSVAGVLLMSIIIFSVMVVAGAVMIGTDGINAAFFKDLFRFVGIRLMLNVAFTGIIVAASELVRNMASAISVAMVIVALSGMISSGLDLLFYKLSLDIRATKYWVLDVISECPMGPVDMEYLKRAIFVTVIWTVLSLAIGALHFQKADIK